MLKVGALLLVCGLGVSVASPFSDLVSDYWSWRLEDAPEFATSIDVHTWDDRVEQYTVDVIDTRKARVDVYLERLAAIRRSGLSPREQVSYDVLKDTLDTYVAGYKWKNYGAMNPVNFLEGLWNDPASFLPSNLTTKSQFFGFATRAFGWADQALNMMIRMRRAIQEKTTNHWLSMNGSISQIDALIGPSLEDNVFVKAFDALLENSTLSDADKAEMNSTIRLTVNYVRQTYDVLKKFILTEYQNETRPAYGVNSLPDGVEYYKACLRWHLSTDQTPEQVHQLGLQEVERIYGEMTKVMGRLRFNGTVKEFFAMLNKNSSFFLGPVQTINRFSDIIFKRVKPKLSRFFKNIPNMPVKVEPQPFDGPGGMYISGSPDGSRPGIFYANVKKREYNPTYGMVALALHEANPGHHLQDIYAQSSPGLEMFRKVADYTKYFSAPTHFPFYTSYAEGWALYAESLGEKDQLDIYQDDYELMGRYSSEIFRACRLVVDTGLHYYNWTREQGVQYMLNYTAESEDAMTIEIDRYITWPGQACAYKVGELKIKELRARAETALGAQFDIRDFHSVVLDNGAVPLNVLEQIVDEWIAQQQASDEPMNDWTAQEKAANVTDEFSGLVDEYWSWRLEDEPEFASAIDVHTYDAKVEAYSIGVLDDRKTKLDGYLQRLEQISRADLEPSDQVSYDILKDTMETYLAGYKWRNYGPMNPVNFLEGLWNDPGANIPESLKTEAEFSSFIDRLAGWKDQVPNMINRMRRAIKEKTTNNWVSMADAVNQIDALIGNSTEENVFYLAIQTALDNATLPQNKKTQLMNRANMTVNQLRTVYGQLNEFIKTEYRSKARTAIGVSSLPDGAEYYKACLRWHLSTDQTPEQVRQLGLQEVARIHGEMVKLVSKLGFNGTVKEFYASLNKDPRFFLNTTEEVLARFREIIFDRADKKLSKYFKDIPDMPVKVEPMPNDGPGGSYRFGSPDGSRPGVFYANVKRPEYHPTYMMTVLALHEADPGHHMQDIYSQTSKDLKMFRRVVDDNKYFASPLHFPFYTAYLEDIYSQSSKGLEMFRRVVDDNKYFAPPLHFPFYTAYGEGWGLYSESLGEKDELDIYKDDYELMGRYSDEIFRACRLVVDTGLHYFNWTREDGIQYMLDYTAESRAAMTVEIDRYITWPGQACAYKVGELKIKELRARAQTELGDKFDIRDFHSLILDNGAMPLRVLENLVDDWIAKQKDTFDKLMTDFFNWRLQSSPGFGSDFTYLYNDQVESCAYEKLDLDLRAVNEFHERLENVEEEALKSDQISFLVLHNVLHTFINGYRWRNYGALNPITFLSGYFTNPGGVMGGPMDTRGDVINSLRRLELRPKQLDEMMDLTRRAIQLGHTVSNLSLSRIPPALAKFVTQRPTDLKMYKDFVNMTSKLFGTDSGGVNQRLEEAIRKFQTKLSELKTFIEKEYMPNTRAGPGVSHLPDGADNYRACVKWHTSLDISPEQVHQKGKEEVVRIAALMKKRMARLGFPATATIGEAFTSMANNTKFLLDTGEETLERFREIIFHRIQPQIPKYFKNVPNLPLVVKPSATDGIGGSYGYGSEDGTRPGTFYANVRRPKDNPTYTMVSLSLHEAIPGHHLQESYSAVSDLPAFRKHMEWSAYNAPYFFPFFNSYVEGWALYSEYLGEEMGIYHDDSEMMGRYSHEMLRATRLVIDSGLHYYNWTRDQAISYMLNYTAESPEGAAIEVDRYATWPGQALGYKLGELKIKELRQHAEHVLGDKFVLGDFHYAILKTGAVPLDVLEKIVNNWVESVIAQTPDVVPGSRSCPDNNDTSGLQSAHGLRGVYLLVCSVILVLIIGL